MTQHTDTTVSRALAACEAAGLSVWAPDNGDARLYDPSKRDAYATLEGGMIHKGTPHTPRVVGRRTSGAHCKAIRIAIDGVDYAGCVDDDS